MRLAVWEIVVGNANAIVIGVGFVWLRLWIGGVGMHFRLVEVVIGIVIVVLVVWCLVLVWKCSWMWSWMMLL